MRSRHEAPHRCSSCPLAATGWYNPDDLQVFNRRERGGIYWFTGGLNIRACLAWLVASTVGLLFLDSSLYVGPWSAAANGIDLSWLSATFIGALVYLVATLLFPEGPAVSGRQSGTGPAASEAADASPIGLAPDGSGREL